LVKKYEGLAVIKVADFGLVKQKDSNLTSSNTELKGVFNDPKLEIVGFHNYNVHHETYALTRLIYFIVTGKIRIDLSKSSPLSRFTAKGISDNPEERYGTVEELDSAFGNIIKYLGNPAI
jgi:eukaryotic-like serine/threonine-protein kinase